MDLVDPKVTVLVVDDEVANLRTFQRVFRHSFQVLLASSAEEAIRVVETQRPEVVFVDYSTPTTNGVVLLEILRRRWLASS